MSAVEDLREILVLLKNRFHVDLAHYKGTTVRRRIERRMSLSHFDTMAAYASHLGSDPEALKALHDDLFIHVTQFFRDPESFKALKEQAFPLLVNGRSPEDPIRVWVPGCSTGEEAYSLAMSLVEFIEERGANARIQIFATDVSEPAVQQARRALYPDTVVSELGGARISRFFERVSEGYKLRKELRELCIISRHDVTSNPPFARLDLISCRNVLIYFGPELQRRIFPVFHYALKPNGFLWLGQSETPGASSNLFSLVDKQHKIYGRAPGNPTYLQLATNVFATETPEFPPKLPQLGGEGDYRKSADQLVLMRYGPPGWSSTRTWRCFSSAGGRPPSSSPPRASRRTGS